MTSSPETLTRFRIVDVETTGTTPNDAVVEIGAVDLVGGEIIPVGSDLVRPPIPIPPEASAVHHITDEDVSDSPTLEELLPFYMDEDRAAGVGVLASHHWVFEGQWLSGRLAGRPVICTYKAAIRVWPEAPGHSNQALRYWLKPKGFRSEFASPVHRAQPDAFVTSLILRELLRVAMVDNLIAWTDEPVLLPRVTFGRHRGCRWDEVPVDYLEWITERSDHSEDVRFTAIHALTARCGTPSLAMLRTTSGAS
jgi:exodeoxyribonuclease X